MQNITAEQLAALRDDDDGELVLLDVRDPWEFEICRLAGSLNIPMDEIEEKAGGLNPEARTVVICHHGMRSFQVGDYLEANGFKDILNLEGGIAAWAERVDRDMSRY